MSYVPSGSTLDEPRLGKLIDLLMEFDLFGEDSPVTLNWAYLETRLSLSREELESAFERASERGLLRSLTVSLDHERWMAASKDKGCLLVMSCVEDEDMDRDRGGLIKAFCKTVVSIRDGIVGDGDTLRHVFVMPNVHLSPRLQPATDSLATVEILKSATSALAEEGFVASLGSFGYSKMLDLTINAHPLGYVLRVL